LEEYEKWGLKIKFKFREVSTKHYVISDMRHFHPILEPNYMAKIQQKEKQTHHCRRVHAALLLDAKIRKMSASYCQQMHPVPYF
jgi:hypothetical protein